ncbi:MAG: hypothetical protein LBE31_06660, partial [Deltaproteobacteria bacterium]|nr:hypothetical protein [Deltaproteobacteria bacterium]
MPEPSPKAPFKWLTTWVYPDNLEPLDVFRGLRPRPGEGMVVEVVIDEPTKTQEKILLGLAKNASTMWPGWYVPWDKAYGEDGLSLWPLYPSAAPSEIRGVDRYWLRRATASIGQNLIPYFSDLPADHQAIQLGLALKHFIDAIHVAIAPDVDFEPGRWVRFDRRLEAIWSLTTIPITFLLSESLSRHSQFEEALYRFQRYEPGTSYSDQAGLFGRL